MNSKAVNEEIEMLKKVNSKLAFNILENKDDMENNRNKIDFKGEDGKIDQVVSQDLVKTINDKKEPHKELFDIFKYKKLVKDPNEEKSEKERKKLRIRFKNKITEVIKLLSMMNMDIDKFINDHVVPTKPYERNGSQKFFNAVKENDTKTIQEMLNKNSYFVYDYDSVKQTPLHWAAKRNYKEVIDLLLKHGSNVNAFDIGGRTPLYLATKASNLSAVKRLLSVGAIPLFKTNSEKTALDVAQDPIIEKYLTRAQLLYICLKLIPVSRRQQVWENEGLYYFMQDDDQSNQKSQK